MIQFDVLADIEEERRQQVAQWGGPQHDDQQKDLEWLDYIHKQMNYAYMRNEYRQRFIKIAALAIAAAESYDRRHPNEHN